MSDSRDSGRSDVSSQAETYRVQHEWSDSEPLYYTVARAVGAITDTHPTDVESVDEVLDPDALDQIFRPTSDGSLRGTGGYVTFVLDGCDVTVYWDGEIVIRIPDDVR
jgi:hypothetical protein